MTHRSFQQEIDVVVQAVRDASALVLDVYASEFSVDLKDAREPVTLADRRSNELLCDRISRTFPADGIVAEESVPKDPGTLASMFRNERLWLIDPLDGTKEFIARNGEFAIMVGLAIGGRPALGIVATPANGDVWIGISGQSTTRIAADGSRADCRVSDIDEMADATLVVSRSHRSRALVDRIERLGVQRLLACGSVGIKASRIASRDADLYVYLHAPGGAKVWDGCGPEALVLGAGGTVTKVDGEPIDYASGALELTGGLLASNGRLHAKLLAHIQAG
ncbi:MAG: 3'(2'),5'-bisphosphate nucleotidase CysQ [Deltaproteobacteria bacterium]|nr:3'(2'),5'-bisphosphate nucleotidase CysQ [Deltaproteobacteria bacterium]